MMNCYEWWANISDIPSNLLLDITNAVMNAYMLGWYIFLFRSAKILICVDEKLMIALDNKENHLFGETKKENIFCTRMMMIMISSQKPQLAAGQLWMFI